MLLGGLAELFGVPTDYFYDSVKAAAVDAQLDAMNALRDSQVRDILLRSADLSQAGRDSISAILSQIRQLEGLDDGPTDRPK